MACGSLLEMVGWRCVGHECAHWWSLIRRGWTVGAASFVRAGSTKVLQCAVYSYAGAWMVMASGEIHYLDAGVHPTGWPNWEVATSNSVRLHCWVWS